MALDFESPAAHRFPARQALATITYEAKEWIADNF
jgi:hypothetical protein